MTRCTHVLSRRLAACGLAGAAVLLAMPAGADQGVYIGAMGGTSLLKNGTADVTIDGETGSTDISFANGAAGGLVAGYSFLNGLRPELEVSYRRNSIDGDGDVRNLQVVGSLYYTISRNGYYYYLGGGGGFANLRASIDGAGQDSDGTPVYSAGTGFGFAISKQWLAGVDFRYAGALERSRFENMVGDVPTEVAFRYRGAFIGFGLRYTFGSAYADSFPVRDPEEPVQVVPLVY